MHHDAGIGGTGKLKTTKSHACFQRCGLSKPACQFYEDPNSIERKRRTIMHRQCYYAEYLRKIGLPLDRPILRARRDDAPGSLGKCYSIRWNAATRYIIGRYITLRDLYLATSADLQIVHPAAAQSGGLQNAIATAVNGSRIQ